jgi:hypothetical protein
MRKLLPILYLLLISISIGQAQENLAASVEITYRGISIRQQGTEEWLALPDGAITPLGIGDQIRSDELGRAIINFSDYGTILLLPNSDLTLTRFEIEQEQVYLEARMLGIFLVEFRDIQNLRFNMPDMQIVEINGNAGLWASDSQADVILVNEGFAAIEFNERRATFGAGEGLRYHPDKFDLAQVTAPYNRARLIGALDGCIGLVRTIEDTRGVIVRTGPGQGFQARGLIQDDEITALLAETESTGWTRIQHANAFGWILSLAVEANCDLATLANDTPEEEILRAVNADERELAILRPFFGIPGLDGFFYQFIAENSDS